MKPEVFAKKLVQAILATLEKRESLWKGTNAWVIWFLNFVGWSNMLDSVVKRMIGFEIKKPEILRLRR
jgi:1-acylglycerone phosphate reductase